MKAGYSVAVAQVAEVVVQVPGIEGQPGLVVQAPDTDVDAVVLDTAVVQEPAEQPVSDT